MTASRVLILNENKVLFIHRIKYGKIYYVLPGGRIEDGETSEQAAIREAKEETSLDVEIDSLLWKIREKYKDIDNEGYYYLVKNFKGKVELGGPEKQRQTKENAYLLEWIPIDELNDLLIFPKGLKERIIEILSN